MAAPGVVSKSARLGAALVLALATPLLQGSLGLRDNLEQRLLAAHNRERAHAGVAQLAWNDDLAAGAAAWGAQLARTGQFEHSPDSPDDEPLGENLFMGTRGYYGPEAMVGAWIEEKRYFQPGVFPHNSRTGNLGDVGHYTQLMWRSTGQVGCAVVGNKSDDYLVCRYSDAGNVEGERPF
ncbi:MAG: SCP-like extracellular [Sphingomonas bacterium]|nr:SCP-like extracellular [Sphingomonas bacterium]